MKEIYNIRNMFDDDNQYENFKQIKKHHHHSNLRKDKNKHSSKSNNIFEHELNEEFNRPSIENRISHPFKISEKNRYYNTIQNVIELATNYPYLSSQFTNSPFLHSNNLGERVFIGTDTFDKNKYAEFAVTANNKYIITLNSYHIDKLIKLTDNTQTDELKLNLLRDIAHEYTHALQQNLEYEYDENNNISPDNMSDLENFYHSILIEADAYTKEKFLLHPNGKKVSQKEIMKFFKNELFILSHRHLNTNYTEEYQYRNMLLQSDFDTDAFHKRMEYILQSATKKTGGTFPQYKLNWQELDGIINNAIVYNTMTEVIELLDKNNKKIDAIMKKMDCDNKSASKRTALVDNLYAKSPNEDHYLLIHSVIKQYEDKLIQKQKKEQQELEKKRKKAIHLASNQFLLNKTNTR